MKRKFLSIFLIIVVTVALAIPSYASESKSDLEDELASVENEKEEVSNQLAETEAQIEELNDKVSTLNSEIAESNEKISQTEAEIAQKQEDMQNREDGLNERLRVMYKNGSIGFIDVLLGSNSISEFVSNLEMIQRIYQNDMDVLETLQKEADELEKIKAQLQMHPVYGTWRYHSGIDIAASSGTNVVAAAPGTVILSQDYGNYSYGECIIIDHGGGITSLYGHMIRGSRRVSVGDTVSAGQVIGLVGSTGVSTGPHLHFEVRENGQVVDPLGYVG